MATPQLEKRVAAFTLTFQLMMLGLMVPCASLSACAVEDIKPVVIKATNCDGKISSAVLSSLRQGISTSRDYRLARDLGDEGKMDVVFTINMSCTERSNMAGIAMAYGQAKCFSVKNCHHVIDGSSLGSFLCGSGATAECGDLIFKSFTQYMRRSNDISP